ncbi:PREDICTED: LOW QUALITY PROTEIN DUF674 domain-containing, partial [Prunus dulcis]
LLSKKRMVGCLGKLYGSLENLNDTYLQPNLNKDPSSYSYSGEFQRAIREVGVREAVTYMITDDLEAADPAHFNLPSSTPQRQNARPDPPRAA